MSSDPVFALDQDFPLTLLDPKYWPGINLRALGELHPDLTADHEDWEVMRDLRLRGGIDGYITLDAKMLNLPREMAVLIQSKLTLVVVEEGGNDPLVATGLLMVYMPQIIKLFDPARPQLWLLKQGEKKPQDPWDQLAKIAHHRSVNVGQLFDDNRLARDTFV